MIGWRRLGVSRRDQARSLSEMSTDGKLGRGDSPSKGKASHRAGHRGRLAWHLTRGLSLFDPPVPEPPGVR